MKRGITRPVKTCQGKNNFHELFRTHVMKNCNEFDLLCHIEYVIYFRVLFALFQSLLCPFTPCKYSLIDNLIASFKPDIDLDMSRSYIQNAVSEMNDN